MSYPGNYANNSSFNKSPANISKILLLTFLAVQAIRQLIQVNGRASAKPPTESEAGKVAAWMTIVMTMVAGVLLYQPKMATVTALLALFVAAMGSGSAMIYDYMNNKTVSLAAEPNRLFFGIAHVIFALLTLVYLLTKDMW